MSDKAPKTVKELMPILNLLGDVKKNARNLFRANMLVHVATLRLLIEAGITTVDAAAKEIEAVESEFSEIFNDKEISTSASWAITMLKGKTPLHGFYLNQAIPKKMKSEEKK